MFSGMPGQGSNVCSSTGCEKQIEKKQACPKCIELGMPPTYFCTQQCFKDNYKTHKAVHALAKQIIQAQQ